MRLLHNAHFHTLHPGQPSATALLIANGRILAAGERSGLLSRAEAGVVEEDLEGRHVYPGLIDAHVHLKQFALALQKVNCETASLAECLRRVEARVRTTPPGEWVLGHGWQQNDWDDCTEGQAGFPNAAMLDALSAEHPIYLTAKSLHAGWANGAALAAAGIHAQTPDPPDGALQRGPSGAPTGILLEGAMSLVSTAVPDPDEAGLRAAIRAAQKHLWALGLTGIHDFDRRDCFVALQQLYAAGELKLRVVKNIPVEDLSHATGVGLRSGFGDAMLRIGNVKAFADGALGPHTAAMLQPYADDPGNLGMLLLDREDLFEYGRLAAENGLGMTVHAIGDRANHEVLEAYANLRRFESEKGFPAYRHRIEHVQLLHPDDIPRLAALDVIASMQPIHATSDMFAADSFWGDRAEYSYAWRTLEKTGARLAFGSDAPVESPNPFWGLHAAITRTRPGGIPSPEGWRPKEKVSRRTAIEGFTKGAAYTGGMENELGTLSGGFLADLVVLEEDLFTCEADQIRDIRPIRTMVGGEWVFER